MASGQAKRLWPVKVVYVLTTSANAPLLRFIVVFYESCGLSPAHIGVLQVLCGITTFAGAIFWSALCDKTGRYKEILCCCYAIAVGFLAMLYLWSGNVVLIFIFSCLGFFFRSVDTGVFDAITLRILEDNKEGYGQQRLWGAVGWGGMSLVTGRMLDVTGTKAFMFYTYASLIAAMIFVLLAFFEFPEKRKERIELKAALRVFTMPSHVWFFLNLIVYGAAMQMVETFLFIYLLQDFEPAATNFLLGGTVAVMCLFELPVFYYSKWILQRWSTTSVLSLCHAILALRCVLYSFIPGDKVLLVLIIEPLHGITFAAMWAASVEHAYRHAPKGLEAVSQSIVASVYRQCGGVAGNLAWGYIIVTEGYRRTYLLDAAMIAGWGVIWALGKRVFFSNAGDQDAESRRALLS
eukprot:GEMP01028185.1.p1 GENE.GEMP01028185.1~~GEMP01028185.1.p1  ORF type:complete len:407 (+),score=61.09 GEMP01028185.1:33-1253(+)